jgi:hypothetical protein
MKALIIALVVLVMAVPAFAGQNPNLAIYLDLDTATPAGENTICPAPNSTFNVYVCFDGFGDGGGLLGAALMFNRTFGGFKLTQTNMLGGLSFGDVETEGWAITSGANCAYPDVNGVLVAAVVNYLYLGTPGMISIIDHPVDGHSAADCNNDLDFWCIHSLLSHDVSGNLGVCMDAPDGNCPEISPVEESSWGSIKALYR